MMFSITLHVEMERQNGEFDHTVSVPVKLTCCSGQWQGMCENPPVVSDRLDSLEEALSATTRLILRDWQTQPAKL